jgi:acylphosphatase
MLNEVVSLHAVVEGHVQGVGFRYFVQECASRLDLTGWVRNQYTGEVELTAEGSRERLERLLDLLRQGPSRSIVTNVKSDWSVGIRKYTHFGILPTE